MYTATSVNATENALAAFNVPPSQFALGLVKYVTSDSTSAVVLTIQLATTVWILPSRTSQMYQNRPNMITSAEAIAVIS
jgi:hypothetical protein